MSSGPQVDWGANIPLYSPDGDLHVIPQHEAQAALADPGTKRAIPMIDPDGIHHWVHEDEVQDAAAAGGRISFPGQEIPKWWGFTPGNIASNALEGAKGLVSGAYDLGKDLVNNPNWVTGPTSTLATKVQAPMEEQVVKGGQELNQPGLGHQIAGAGHVLAGSVPLIGPWAATLGEQVGRGDVGGAAGQAAGVVGAGMAPGLVKEGLNKVVPARPRAGVGIRTLTERNATLRPKVGESYRIAREVTDSSNLTGASIPEPLRAYAERITGGDAERNPITFHEMQEFKKALGATGDPTARAVASHIAAEQQAAANTAGFGKDWRAQANEYRRGSTLVRAADAAGPLIGGGIGYEIGKNLGQPVGGTVIGGALGRGLGKATVGKLARAVIDREAGPPRLTKPVAPPVSPKLVTPEAPTAELGTRPTPAPVSTVPASGERRVDVAGRAAWEKMTPEEQFQAGFTNHVTGLPNKRGFKAAEAAGPSPAYGFSDVAGLKWLNDNYGDPAGDTLLKMKAQALREAGVDAAHIGGDEFAHRGGDLTRLHQRLTKANDIFNKMILNVRNPKTGEMEHFTGADFRFGVGPDMETANQGMLQRKAIDKSRGKQGTLRKLPKPPMESVR